MRKLLLTGASGFLGWNIIQQFKRDWQIYGTFRRHPLTVADFTSIQVDLTRYHDIKELINRVAPDAVIHAAAMSDPNFCQQNQAETDKINIEASANIAGLCADRKIPCLFTSSDLVFDGLTPPYGEQDAVSPINRYGEQKVLAEIEMRKKHPGTVICRMPLMFGTSGPVAVKSLRPMIHAMKTGVEVNLFVDEYRTPISAKDAAHGLLIALQRLPEILHLGGAERISRFDFGRLLAEVFQISDAVLTPRQLSDHGMPAPRPPDISLDSSKARSMGFQPGSLKSELKHLHKIIGSYNSCHKYVPDKLQP